MINVNLEKSSSSAVYEYFTGKHEDIKVSHVSKNLDSFMRFCSLASHTSVAEIGSFLNSIKGVIPSFMDAKDKGRVELILKYIEDGDLRQWSLPGIKAFNVGLGEWRSKFSCISNPYMFKQV